MSESSNSMGTSITESGDMSPCSEDSLHLEPVDMNIKTEADDEELHEDHDHLQHHPNELPSIAMADGTIVNEPTELDILHALDQKINRLERMTVGIFEIIRHLGVQVHGVSNHLANVENKVEHLIQRNSVDGGNMSVSQAALQPLPYVQDHASADVQGMINQHAAVPMSEITSIHTHADSAMRRLSWNERFEELKRYKDSNGHCDVPQIYDTGLGTWVSAQRSQYKRYAVGKTSSMTHQRKASLDKIGFSWSLRKRFSWDERYAELKHYSDTHNGSCDVPNEGDYKALWTWCQNQKQAYKRGREGKSHPVPAERVQMMEQIGFRWATTSGDASYLPLSSPTEDDSSSPMSDSDDEELCSEIGEL